MSLIAYRETDGVEIESFSIDRVDWNAMRRQPIGAYRMIGTRWPAVLKRSPRGLQFFAHAPGFLGERPERKTEQHYMAQIGLVRGLRNAGFKPKLEHGGRTKDGQLWRADVFCNALGRQIAYEVQLSQQTLEEYERRSARYARSGVKCVWLIRSPRHYFAFRTAIIRHYNVPVYGSNAVRWPGVQHLAALPIDVGRRDDELSADAMKVMTFTSTGVEPLSLAEFAVGVAYGKLVFSRNEWRWR